MNKLTKVSCSALCGSLAAVSAAQAGDMTVTGGVDMSWISKSSDTTGNPIGIGSNLTFKGSGELDNGWTFDYTVAHLNGGAYSSAAVAITMGGLGKLNVNQGDSGNGIDAMDDKTPTAWEETWGAGLSTGIKMVSGVGTSMNIQYTTPTVLGTTIVVAMAPQMGVVDTADKTSGAGENELGKGYDATININPSLGTEILSGLNLFVGGHYTEHETASAAYANDLYEGVAGATFSLGPVSIGYQQTGHTTGKEHSTSAVSHYRGNMYGVSFNINDNLSVSYGKLSSRKAGFTNASANAIAGDENARRVEAESIQIAYTMGGASIRLAEVEGTNVGFSANNNKDATVVSVSLAF
jgi:outer membrane protein OmpU